MSVLLVLLLYAWCVMRLCAASNSQLQVHSEVVIGLHSYLCKFCPYIYISYVCRHIVYMCVRIRKVIPHGSSL